MNQLSGRWSCAGAFGSGKPLAADIEFTPVLAGRWVQYHHLDRAPGRYEASALLGPATFDSTLVPTTLFDNFGGHRRFQLTQSPENRITLLRDMSDPGARVERFVFEPRSQAQLWFAWEVQRDGAWVLGDSLQCRRG